MPAMDLSFKAGGLLSTVAVVSATLLLVVAALYWFGLPRPIPGIPYNKDAAKRWLGDAPDFVEHFKTTGEGWDWFCLQCEKLQSRE